MAFERRVELRNRGAGLLESRLDADAHNLLHFVHMARLRSRVHRHRRTAASGIAVFIFSAGRAVERSWGHHRRAAGLSFFQTDRSRRGLSADGHGTWRMDLESSCASARVAGKKKVGVGGGTSA